MNLIEGKNLSFSYSAGGISRPVIRDLSLDIAPGDFTAIKGPSGSGKSTLLYLLSGLLRPQSGSVYFAGADLYRLSDLELAYLRNRRIGFVFQQFHLLQKNNVLQNVLLPTMYPVELAPPPEKAVVEKAEALLGDLGLGDHLDHLPNQLSGGQQQRVAIARALVNDNDVIFADEPTGNLDEKSSRQILDIFSELNRRGKTIVLITHENEVAQACRKTLYFREGRIEKIEERRAQGASRASTGGSAGQSVIEPINEASAGRPGAGVRPYFARTMRLAWQNIARHRIRSFLTMIGIIVGIASVCAMVTLGRFTKDRILTSYADLGVNTLLFRGYPNWDMKATDQFSVIYRFFDWEKDILPLRRIFPDVRLMSPVMTGRNVAVAYAGKTVENDPRLVGVAEDGLEIAGRKLLAGRGISRFHVERNVSVCVIGFEIADRLFRNTSPLGKVMHIAQDSASFACKVIGVLESKTSNNEWTKPNSEIYVPFTVFQAVSENWWSSQMKEVTIRVNRDSDIEKVGQGIRAFFEKKYGKSGEFWVDSDSVLVAQMEKFLNLFSVLLLAIALISLSVGGIGIANMMLVSVSERIKEIGLRKSFGATDGSIRAQFLCEALILCSLAGLAGIGLGIVAYETAIWGAARIMQKFEFEWVIDGFAILLSLVSIFLVGLLSGLIPAVKAEKLQVIEALRNE